MPHLVGPPSSNQTLHLVTFFPVQINEPVARPTHKAASSKPIRTTYLVTLPATRNFSPHHHKPNGNTSCCPSVPPALHVRHRAAKQEAPTGSFTDGLVMTPPHCRRNREVFRSLLRVELQRRQQQEPPRSIAPGLVTGCMASTE